MKNFKISNYPFLFSICCSFDMCFSLIPFIISNIKSKKGIKSKKYIETIKKMKIQKIFFIFIDGFMDFSQTLLCSFVLKNESTVNFQICDFFLIALLSLLILKRKFYKHHYFILIIFILLAISSIIIQIFNLHFDFLDFIYVFTQEVFFSLLIVLEKYIMEYKFCSPYRLCFDKGFISLILYGITLGILYLFKEKQYIEDFKTYYKEINIKEIILVFIFMILHFLYNITFILANVYSNHFYIFFCIIIHLIVFNILEEIEEIQLIINFVFIFILLLIILVFNEIIELNCFGLERKTVKNMKILAEIDSYLLNDNDTKIEIDGYKFELTDI